MIIKGKPEEGLQEHQQSAYNAITKALETSDRAAFVMPTGCGKSFVALQLMEEYRDKNILFLTSRTPIRSQMYSYIKEYIVGEENNGTKNDIKIAEEHFPNLKIMLYDNLLRVDSDVMKKINADLIIMDELHRTGAEKWGQKVDQLLESNPNAKILGMTATPDRMDNQNVIDNLFEGKVSYELTLVDAIKRGIVTPPDYVKCVYSLNEELTSMQEKIASSNLDETSKNELEEKYEKMRRIVEDADGIPELFSKNMKNKSGKYVVFCKSKEHMDEIISKVPEWFDDIDKNPEIYSVYSGNEQKSDDEQIKKFIESQSEHLKLLFSIEKLNEGLHMSDISGVIMLRPTDSRIVYLQQLGRALSSVTAREKTIVFDLVGNYLKVNLDKEINDVTEKDLEERNLNQRIRNEQKTISDIDIFKISGETKEFLDLLEESNAILGVSDYLTNAKKIKEWMEEKNTTKPPAVSSQNKEEKKLGRALNYIKNVLIKSYKTLENEEEKRKFEEKHPEIIEVMEIVNWIDENNISLSLLQARKIKEWMEKNGTTKPPVRGSQNEGEKKLGYALNNLKNGLIKQYKMLESEEEKRKFEEKHPEIFEIVQIVDEINANNISPYLKNARDIKEWMEKNGTIKPPVRGSQNEEEKKLGCALNNLKNGLIKQYKMLESEEEKRKFETKHPEIFEIVQIVDEIDANNISLYLKNARDIKEWMKKNNTSIPPKTSSSDKEEKRLGIALVGIKQYFKPYTLLNNNEEKKKFEKEHPDVFEIMQIIDEIDANKISRYLKNARDIKEWMKKNNTSIPPKKISSDTEEKRLGIALVGIKQYFKPYTLLNNNEEKRKFETKHPDVFEIMQIIDEINTNNINPYLKNVRDIKEWMKEKGTTKSPSQTALDIEEKRLGIALSSIRKQFIKPYMLLDNNEEKKKFEEKHPEIFEVMEIVDWIDTVSGKKKQAEVFNLACENEVLDEKIRKAKELEAIYKDTLNKNERNNIGEDDE